MYDQTHTAKCFIKWKAWWLIKKKLAWPELKGVLHDFLKPRFLNKNERLPIRTFRTYPFTETISKSRWLWSKDGKMVRKYLGLWNGSSERNFQSKLIIDSWTIYSGSAVWQWVGAFLTMYVMVYNDLRAFFEKRSSFPKSNLSKTEFNNWKFRWTVVKESGLILRNIADWIVSSN